MKTLLLIDAYAMIYRAYYAFIRAPRMNSRGENTSAVFGFVVTFEDLLKRLKPTHIAVAFDPAGPTFRHEAFEQYKAQRQETPEDIRWAVPRIKRILQAMNVPVLEVPGYEADDVFGTIAHKSSLMNDSFISFLSIFLISRIWFVMLSRRSVLAWIVLRSFSDSGVYLFNDMILSIGSLISVSGVLISWVMLVKKLIFAL